ncbi:hypothetical protein [Herbiconiux liukaitaii]|uniref:hypothetical protein n=1 Tax=Herbiconiux liukaitaii TaxID=3342799 RepID=UPI0035B820EB
MSAIEKHDDPARVLATIESGAREIVLPLLDSGFTVKEAWGPVQMAVASLLLERDGTEVLFDAERGLTGVYLTHAGRRTWLSIAIYAWACSPAPDARVRVPGFVPWSLIAAHSWGTRGFRDLGQEQTRTYGVPAIEWLPQADAGLLDTIEHELSSRSTARSTPKDEDPDTTAARLAARYEQAVARYLGDAQP